MLIYAESTMLLKAHDIWSSESNLFHLMGTLQKHCCTVQWNTMLQYLQYECVCACVCSEKLREYICVMRRQQTKKKTLNFVSTDIFPLLLLPLLKIQPAEQEARDKTSRHGS